MSLSGLHTPPWAHTLPTVNIICTHRPPLHHLTHIPKKIALDSNNTFPKTKKQRKNESGM